MLDKSIKYTFTYLINKDSAKKISAKIINIMIEYIKFFEENLIRKGIRKSLLEKSDSIYLINFALY